MTQNPLGSGKARLRPCEASVRPWSGPGGETTRPGPEKASVGPLGGRFWGETAGLGKLAKPVGRKPPSLPFLAALAGAERDAKPFPF